MYWCQLLQKNAGLHSATDFLTSPTSIHVSLMFFLILSVSGVLFSASSTLFLYNLISGSNGVSALPPTHPANSYLPKVHPSNDLLTSPTHYGDRHSPHRYRCHGWRSQQTSCSLEHHRADCGCHSELSTCLSQSLVHESKVHTWRDLLRAKTPCRAYHVSWIGIVDKRIAEVGWG